MFRDVLGISQEVTNIVYNINYVWIVSMICILVYWVRVTLWYQKPIIDATDIDPRKIQIKENEEAGEESLAGKVRIKIKDKDYIIRGDFIIINVEKSDRVNGEDYRIPISHIGFIKYKYHYRTEPMPSLLQSLKDKFRDLKERKHTKI